MAGKGHVDPLRANLGRRRMSMSKRIAAVLAMFVGCAAALYLAWGGGPGGGGVDGGIAGGGSGGGIGGGSGRGRGRGGSGSSGSSSSSSSSSNSSLRTVEEVHEGGTGRVLEAAVGARVPDSVQLNASREANNAETSTKPSTDTNTDARTTTYTNTSTSTGATSDPAPPTFGRVRVVSLQPAVAGSHRQEEAVGGGDGRDNSDVGDGDGDVSTAIVGVRKCFHVEVLDDRGDPFDRAENGTTLHRAFLVCHGMLVGSTPQASHACSSSSGSGSDVGDGGGSSGDGCGGSNSRIGTCSASSNSSMVRFTTEVQFDAATGTHRMCFTPPAVGNLCLELFLVFTNAFQITSTYRKTNGVGYADFRSVSTLIVKVSPPPLIPSPSSTSAEAFSTPTHNRSSLPRCTLPMIEASRGEGFWEGSRWNPSTCRLRETSCGHILRCLNGLNILFLGDSQTRYLFGFLLTFLSFPTREAFLRRFAGNPSLPANALKSLKGKAHNNLEWQKYLDREDLDDVARRELEFMGRTYIFCGSLFNGFTRMRVRTWVGPTHVDFNLTYVPYFGIGRPPVRRWMVDPTKCDGHIVFEPQTRDRHRSALAGKVGGGGGGRSLVPAQPFDMVVVASQLHDVLHFHNADDYGRKMREEFERDLRPLVKNGEMHRLVLFGGWAAQERQKPRHFVHISNSLRSAEFEDAAEEALLGTQQGGAQGGGRKGGEKQRKLWKKPPHVRVLRMGAMTQARPDLCIDSTHYSWPVSLAMVDMWLGSACGLDLR